jgi:hypothetical protein
MLCSSDGFELALASKINPTNLGKVALTGIENQDHPMVMVAVASRDVLVGQFLFVLKKATK